MDKNWREYDVEDVEAYDQLSHFQYETVGFLTKQVNVEYESFKNGTLRKSKLEEILICLPCVYS